MRLSSPSLFLLPTSEVASSGIPEQVVNRGYVPRKGGDVCVR
jgi:hypothetical protein